MSRTHDVGQLRLIRRTVRSARLERGILLAEGARARGGFDHHVSYQFRGRGFGLLAYDELGLHGVSQEDLRSRVARAFVTELPAGS